MKQEFKQVLRIFKQLKKTIKNSVLNWKNSDTMKKCLNSQKVKLQVVLRLLMPLMFKSDGWKNYGNTLRNVKTDLMIT